MNSNKAILSLAASLFISNVLGAMELDPQVSHQAAARSEISQEVIKAYLNNPQNALFHLAREGNSVVTMQDLLEAGAQINKPNSNSNTALIIAASYGHSHIIKELLAKGAHIDMENSQGETALMYAAKFRYSEAIKELIAHGAQINKEDSYGFTALHHAIGAYKKTEEASLQKDMSKLTIAP